MTTNINFNETENCDPQATVFNYVPLTAEINNERGSMKITYPKIKAAPYVYAIDIKIGTIFSGNFAGSDSNPNLYMRVCGESCGFVVLEQNNFPVCIDYNNYYYFDRDRNTKIYNYIEYSVDLVLTERE